MIPRAAVALAVVSTVAAATPRHSEAQAVAGRLVDRATRRVIKHAIVMLKDTSNTMLAQTMSDTAGEFLLNLEGPGRYWLDFRAGRDPLGASETFAVGPDEFYQRVYVVDAPSEAPVYFEFQVAKPAEVLPPSYGPQYPPDLRARNVEGRVLAQFVVDTTGRPVLGTLRILTSSDPAFTKSVERFIWSLRFRPAELKHGRRVRQLVQMPFEFTLQ